MAKMKTSASLLFASSSLFVSFGIICCSVFDISVMTEKTEHKNLSAVNQPIVINMPVYEEKYLFGKRNSSGRTERIGDMFVIIDWETNTVYDWVYYGGEHHYTFDRPVEVGENPVKYYSAMSGSGKVACLDPEKTNVSITETGQAGMFYNRFTPGKYCVKDFARHSKKSGKEEFCVRIYDTEKGRYSDADLSVEQDNYPDFLVPDSAGNFWFSYMLDKYGYVSKLDCANEKIETLGISIDCTEKDSAGLSFSTRVLYAGDEYLLLYKGISSGNHANDRLYVIEQKPPHNIKAVNIALNPREYIYSIVSVNDALYGIAPYRPAPENADSKLVNIYRIDIENLASERINAEPIDIDFTDNAWVRENRIYLMSSRSARNVYYNYFDVETRKTGEGWHVSQSEIVRPEKHRLGAL